MDEFYPFFILRVYWFFSRKTQCFSVFLYSFQSHRTMIQIPVYMSMSLSEIYVLISPLYTFFFILSLHDRKVKDAQMRATINQKLVETGERERLVITLFHLLYSLSLGIALAGAVDSVNFIYFSCYLFSGNKAIYPRCFIYL